MTFLSRLAKGLPAFRRAYATVSDVSGVKVAGIENGSRPGTTSITVVVKGGSRYESKPGVAHVLKTFSFKVRLMSLMTWGGFTKSHV